MQQAKPVVTAAAPSTETAVTPTSGNQSPARPPARLPLTEQPAPLAATPENNVPEFLSRSGSSAPGVRSLLTTIEEDTRPQSDEPIVDVRFEGNATIPVATMSRYIKCRPGRPVTEDQVREDVRSLLNTKWFFSIHPVYRRQNEGVVLVFKVVERPILREVEYRGNEKLKEHVLAGITGLKPLHAFSVATNREAARRIKEHYVDKGYMFAEVTLAEGGNPEDRRAIFEIVEGPRVQVSSIQFQGNEDISSEVLKLQLATKKRILWKFGGQYDPSSITQDIAAIKEYYHNIGYFDIQISEQVNFADDRATVIVTYSINEGPRYKIRKIELKGNQIFSAAELTQDFKVKEGSLYSARDLAKDVTTVQQKYGQLGRLFAKVIPTSVFTQEPGVVDLVIAIDEDQVRKIGMINVHIRGDHTHTKETVALNQLLVAPGDLADPEKIRRSKARLAGAAIWEGGGGAAPEINVSPVTAPTYLARDTPREPMVARGSGGYFGQEKPLELETLDLSPSIKQALNAKEIIPTAHQQAGNPSGTVNAVIPGAGHTLKPRPQQPNAVQQPASQDRVYRQERPQSAPAAHSEQSSIYQPVDLHQTNVFQTPADGPFLTPLLSREEKESEAVVRAQNFDNYTAPPNLMYSETPQGDLLGPQLPSPVTPPGYVDLDVYLTEARTGRFMVGAGVNSDSGVVGNIVLEEQNFDIMRFPTSFRDVVDGYAFRGGGQQFRLDATPGSDVSRYMASWTDPYFLNTDYSLGVSGFFYQRYFRDWSEERLGGRINVGKLLTRELSFNTALRLENVDIRNPRLPYGAAPSIDEMLGDNFLGTGRFTLGYDTRDSAYMATEGFNLTGSVEQAFGDYHFTKLELQGSEYFTVYQRPDGAGKHVLSLRGNLGWSTDDTPSFERFYAGGFQSFRGFEFRAISPLEPQALGTNAATVGGFFQMLGTVEYMMPVMANEAVRVVAFSDFGTVDEDVSLDKFRMSVGAGLRITVPQMGPVPIALDWAYPIIKEPTDIRQIFSFYIGITR